MAKNVKRRRTGSRHSQESRKRSEAKVKTISGRLNKAKWTEFDRLCRKYKVSKHAVITTAVKDWIDHQKEIEKA